MLSGGVEDIVKKSFLSVFDEINARTEAWWQASRLESIGRERYAKHLIDEVATFSLFATSRSVLINQAFVNVRVSADLERTRYKAEKDIEAYLRHSDSHLHVHGSGTTPIINAIQANEHGVALVGTAGSGKTTLFRYLALLAARGFDIRHSRRIPLFLAVRDLAEPEKGIRAACIELLNRLEIGEADAALTMLLKRGKILLLLDGIDETNKKHQRQLLEEMRRWRVDYPTSLLCVSGRPLALDVSLPGFVKWETLPFTTQDRQIFIEKWFEPVSPEKGKKLIELAIRRPDLIALGTNPLMLSIVCALYHNDLQLPRDTDELFDRAIQGLLGQWDIFRDIARHSCLAPLSIRQRVTLVSWLAAALFRDGHIVFSWRTVEKTGILDAVAAFLRVTVPASDELLQSLYSDFGILTERAPGMYSFLHLQIQEYLVARYIAENRREEDLIDYRHDENWHDVIRLTARMVPNATQFLLAFHTCLTYPPSRREISQLVRIWQSHPSCDPSVRKQMMRDLAGILVRLGKVANVVKAGFSVQKGVLFLAPPTGMNSSECRKRLERNSMWNAFRESAPGLITIIAHSGYTFADLGVKSKLTDVLENGNMEVSAVEIQPAGNKHTQVHMP